MTDPDSHPSGVDPTAAAVALAWVEHLRQGDIDALWPATSHAYRLALTQWWMTANHAVLDDTTVKGRSRKAVAEEISTGQHPLFSHLRRVLARDLRASVGDLADLALAPGTAARLVGPDIELVALFVEEDVSYGTFAPGTMARVATIAVTRNGGDWLVAGLNCVAVPGWPPTWSPVDASLTG